MPNDAPDWSTVGSSPAIDLGSFTVPANTLVTVFNGLTPPGCHAVKVYIESTDPTANAQQVTVINGTTIHVVQQFLLPKSTSCISAVDDVSVPNLRVDVLAAFSQLTTGRVVAFLSDQAVAVDNDNSNPVPVSIISVGSSATPSGGSVPVEIGPNGVPVFQVSGGNAAQSVTIPAPPTGKLNRLSHLAISWSGATAGAPAVTITDAVPTVVWEAVVALPGGPGVVPPFAWPVPLVITTSTGAMIINVGAAGAAGVVSVIAAVYSVY